MFKATAFCCYFERLIQRGVRGKKKKEEARAGVHWRVIPFVIGPEPSPFGLMLPPSTIIGY